MSQFDVHQNAISKSQDIPFVLDVQSELLSDLETRIIVPMEAIPADHSAIKRLNPIFEIQGRRVILVPTEIATVPKTDLGEVVANLGNHRDIIISAIDFSLFGR